MKVEFVDDFVRCGVGCAELVERLYGCDAGLRPPVGVTVGAPDGRAAEPGFRRSAAGPPPGPPSWDQVPVKRRFTSIMRKQATAASRPLSFCFGSARTTACSRFSVVRMP